MNITDLIVFKYVARSKSISVAAKELHMTQPAITNILNKLEKRYNLIFFDRSRQGTFLNENGQEFLKSIEQLLIEYENLENRAFELQNHGLHKIILATYPSVTIYCLAECMESESFKQSPYILAIREGNDQEVREWMSSGDADFSISIKDHLIPGFNYNLIGDDPYVLVAPKSITTRLTASDLKKFPFIMPISGCKEVIENYLKQNNIHINKVIESDTVFSTLALAKQFNAITIVPLSGLNKQFTNDFTVQPLEIRIQRQLIMQWPPMRESDPMFMSYINKLTDQLQKRNQLKLYQNNVTVHEQ
jgi:LysR family tdc operon transcriptional activator